VEKVEKVEWGKMRQWDKEVKEGSMRRDKKVRVKGKRNGRCVHCQRGK